MFRRATAWHTGANARQAEDSSGVTVARRSASNPGVLISAKALAAEIQPSPQTPQHSAAGEIASDTTTWSGRDRFICRETRANQRTPATRSSRAPSATECATIPIRGTTSLIRRAPRQRPVLTIPQASARTLCLPSPH